MSSDDPQSSLQDALASIRDIVNRPRENTGKRASESRQRPERKSEQKPEQKPAMSVATQSLHAKGDVSLGPVTLGHASVRPTSGHHDAGPRAGAERQAPLSSAMPASEGARADARLAPVPPMPRSADDFAGEEEEKSRAAAVQITRPQREPGDEDGILDLKRVAAPLPTMEQGVTVEALARSLLEPMLRDWLDEHLPEIVEREIAARVRRLIDRS